MEKNCKKYILHITVYWYFLATSLSNLVNNISERIHKIKFKYRYDDKNFQTCRNKYKYCDCFLEYINFKDDLIEYKCYCCNKIYQKKFDEKLKEQFFNTFKCSNHDNKFILLLQKVVCPEECINYLEKLNETLKEDFYSHLSMEDIKDADYANVNSVKIRKDS